MVIAATKDPSTQILSSWSSLIDNLKTYGNEKSRTDLSAFLLDFRPSSSSMNLDEESSVRLLQTMLVQTKERWCSLYMLHAGHVKWIFGSVLLTDFLSRYPVYAPALWHVWLHVLLRPCTQCRFATLSPPMRHSECTVRWQVLGPFLGELLMTSPKCPFPALFVQDQVWTTPSPCFITITRSMICFWNDRKNVTNHRQWCRQSLAFCFQHIVLLALESPCVFLDSLTLPLYRWYQQAPVACSSEMHQVAQEVLMAFLIQPSIVRVPRNTTRAWWSVFFASFDPSLSTRYYTHLLDRVDHIEWTSPTTNHQDWIEAIEYHAPELLSLLGSGAHNLYIDPSASVLLLYQHIQSNYSTLRHREINPTWLCVFTCVYIFVHRFQDIPVDLSRTIRRFIMTDECLAMGPLPSSLFVCCAFRVNQVSLAVIQERFRSRPIHEAGFDWNTVPYATLNQLPRLHALHEINHNPTRLPELEHWVAMTKSSRFPKVHTDRTARKKLGKNIRYLPTDILVEVLSYLQANRLRKIASVSRWMKACIDVPILWKHMVSQRWPDIVHCCQAATAHDWKAFYRTRIQRQRQSGETLIFCIYCTCHQVFLSRKAYLPHLRRHFQYRCESCSIDEVTAKHRYHSCPSFGSQKELRLHQKEHQRPETCARNKHRKRNLS